MKQSPKQQILALLNISQGDGKWSENAQSYKSQLLDRILPYLEREDGESETDAKNRMLGEGGKGSLSNGKLLKLYGDVQRLKNEFGGKKDQLIDILLKSRVGASGKIDADYRRHLQKKSVGTLLLTYDHAVKSGAIDR